MSIEGFHSIPRHQQATRNQSNSFRQNKGTIGPEKNRVLIFFEIFVLSELVCSYDKVNKYEKKKFHVVGTLS